VSLGASAPRCLTCGAKVLTACPECGIWVRGRYVVPGVIGGNTGYKAPSFCDQCARPFRGPTVRHGSTNSKTCLTDEDLDDATELAVREHLEALTSADLDEAEQISRWRRGTTCLLPILRVGNIAALPAEPVHLETGRDNAALVEILSIGGLSGSPAVFIFRSLGGTERAAAWPYLMRTRRRTLAAAAIAS
jgi:hypothetical protein